MSLLELAAWVVLGVVAAAVLCVFGFGVLIVLVDRQERAAKNMPLSPPVPVQGCPWCDDRGVASQCDCTADCSRWCCMAGSGGAILLDAGDGAALERQISDMIERYGRG